MVTRTVLLVVYPGFELLDLAGPLAVFGAANALSSVPPYLLQVVSMNGGVVQDGLGLPIGTVPAPPSVPVGTTLIVMGALEDGLRQATGDTMLADWLVRMTGSVDRIGSVCTGAFVLAASGLLNGRKATTHWMGCERLARFYPSITVEPNALYVTDGHIWTSAGVTAGVDMALAMVRSDINATLMSRVARRLVVYAHRPGGQSQFSEALRAQTVGDGVFTHLVDWIDAHLRESLTVQRLAAQAGMSERSFYRKFTATMGTTPRQFVAEMRMTRARSLLQAGSRIKDVGRQVGFGSESQFRQTFSEHFGTSPATHRTLHSGS